MQTVTRYTRWLIFILIAFALPAQAQADLAAFAIAGDVPREKPAPTRGSPALYVSGPDRSQEQTDWDSPFGFHPAGVFKRGYQDSGYTDATNIGVGWTRQGVYAFWFLIQPDLNQQVYDFSFYDRQWGEIPWDMNILANIAPQGRIDEGRCLPESWLPVDEAKYAAFVTATVERYDGDGIDDMPGLVNPIRHWQVGNEPNDRRPSDFAELQRITYQAIKQACPDCTVLIGGVPGGPENYITNFDVAYAPILAELAGQYVDVFDFHWYGTATGEYRLRDAATGEDVLEHIRATLTAHGFPADLPLWITEMGAYSGDPTREPDIFPFQTERQQALDYFKRFIYPLSRGVEKVFPAFGLMEGFKYDSGYFDFTGLIYDGWGPYDMGLGVKKLGYFTYKKMTEKLEGSDWDNIETVINGTDNVYAYKFTNKDTGEPVYVAWWDYFDEPGYTSGDTKTITLSGLTGTAITVTNAVPAAESGLDVTDYTTAFTITTYPVADGSSTIVLGEAPVFVEMFNIDIQANGSDGPLSITPNDALSVTVELDPGNNSEINADWWLAADTPFGWFYFDALTWSWTHVFTYAYQGALFELNPPFEVLDISELQTGAYTFYFAVDIDMNGTLDEPLYYDSVLVNVLD